LSKSPLLKVHSLSFERDDANVFAPVSFAVEAGDIVQIEGANGAGKTTLLRLLTMVLQPSDGAIEYKGQSLDQCRYDYLSDILYLGHQPGIKLTLTPEENLRWSSPGAISSAALANALQQVGLGGYQDVPCYSLSAGQHRRVALARLLTTEASIWFLDEPFTAIDKQGIISLQSIMQRHIDQGGIILLSSHQDLALASVRKYSIEPHADRGLTL
jgi:heme exporter protein A